MPPTLGFSTRIIVFSILYFVSCAKVLQITQKNLPNVLRFQSDILMLYHHPDCKYSTNYKLKFTQHFQNANTQTENVGVVDCSQENNLCVLHNVTSYPAVKKIYNNLTAHQQMADILLGNVNPQYQETDEYLANKIALKLKQSPNFIFVLFEEEGLPVSQDNKLKNAPYSDRIFYLSQGRVAKTLGGFVKNKPGCWIFELRSQQSGELYRFHCGSTYQSFFQLEYQIQKYLNETSIKKPHKPTQIELTDQSNHENETILGYKQFIYWVKNYNLQMEISTHIKISMCKFIYLWSAQCEHCNYEADMKSIKRSIVKAYQKNPFKSNEQLSIKYLIHSYDIENNRLIISSRDLIKIAALNATQVQSDPDNGPLLLPNLLSICFSTPNSRNLGENTFMQVKKLDKIIASENIQKFVHQILNQQHAFIQNTIVKQMADPTKTDL